MKAARMIGIAVLSVAVLAGVGWFAFPLGQVTVTGSEIYSEDEIKGLYMGGLLSGNAICLYVRDRLVGYPDVPFVEEVQLEWTSLRDVTVRVYEKSLVACFSCMGEYVYFDKDGVVLESSKERIGNAPLVEGIEYAQFTLNKKIEVEKENLFKRILDISQLIKHYGLEVDKVEFDKKDEVTFYCGKIRVDLGNREEYDQPIVALSSVLEQARKKDLGGTIDLKGYQEGGRIYLATE